ncbi:hypothetical protein CSB37_02105 [bacterium DOLZORAL124_38_8]|nr:MAG: hypothetical protein CSB37_02105 [bacterium DOLZORAL124_38_8]
MKITTKKPAFSIIEVMIAMVILSMAVLAGFKLIGSFITTVAQNQTRLTATYLAQECLENARNQRDINWRNFDNWTNELETLTKDEEKFGTFKISREISTKNKNIDFVGTNSGGQNIKMIQIPVEATITCTVSRNNTKIVEMQSILTNWKK